MKLSSFKPSQNIKERHIALCYDPVDETRVVPIIKEKISDILDFIDEIPETFNNQIVCSQIRKNYYKLGLITRLEKLLIPALIAR